ncbi:Conjugative relaxosome accessory transposon protein [compost metagenome]
MKTRHSSLSVSLLCALAFSSQPVMAENPMKSIFSDMMTNSTAPTTFETSKRFGVSGGGFSARIPRVTPNIISVVPPKLNAGCGGMDFFTGSFSIINKDQLVQVMRGVANGAATYAFSVGMQAVCATCMSTLESLSSELNKFNALSRDACSESYKQIANSSLGQEAMQHFSDRSLINPPAIQLGLFSDWGEVDSDNKTNKANTLAKASPATVQTLAYNLVWEQLNGLNVQNWAIQGATGYNWRELMQSLLGTVIVQVKKQDNESSVIASDPIAPTMTAMDLLKASATITVLSCGSDVAKCMKPTVTQVNDWKGLSQTIAERLMVIHPAIKDRKEATLSNDDKMFLNIISAEFKNYLAVTPVGLADSSIELYSTIVANDVIAVSIKGFVARMKQWIGTNKVDQQARYIEQLNRAMDGLDTQMRDLSKETQIAQERFSGMLQTRESLRKEFSRDSK